MTISSPPPAAANTLLAPLRIEIGGAGSIAYKSIDELRWDNIPSFAVLTGLNGSGKTQLLELLAYKLTETFHPQMQNVTITVSGDTFGPDAVAYLPSRWDVAGASLGMAQMQDAKRQLYQQLRQAHNIRGDLVQRSKRARLEKILGESLDSIDIEAFVKRVPNDFAFMLDELIRRESSPRFGSLVVQLTASRPLPEALPPRRAGCVPSSLDDKAFPQRNQRGFGRPIQS